MPESFSEAPWSNDRLSRKKSADFLTKYLTGLYGESKLRHRHESFVLALNARWGSGKSYFLRNWGGELKQSGHPAILFDAWKSDFSHEPLLAFIAELREGLAEYVAETAPAKAKFRRFVNGGKAVMKGSIPILAEAAARKLAGIGLDELGELIDEEEMKEGRASIAKGVDRAAAAMLKGHTTTKKSIETFRQSLSELVEDISARNNLKLPLFVFVDELDRCRPSYAIELLEHIKHVFGVPRVYFIAATDTAQLANSVQSLYGHAFDAEGYLRRFFDQEYTLPSPERLAYASFLVEEYGLATKQFVTPLKGVQGVSAVATTFATICDWMDIAARDMEYACTVVNAIRLSKPDQTIHIGQHESPGSRTPSELPLFELVRHYFELSRVERHKLLEQTDSADAMKRDAARQLTQVEGMSQWTTGQKYPNSLVTYGTLIKQAGHLGPELTKE